MKHRLHDPECNQEIWGQVFPKEADFLPEPCVGANDPMGRLVHGFKLDQRECSIVRWLYKGDALERFNIEVFGVVEPSSTARDFETFAQRRIETIEELWPGGYASFVPTRYELTLLAQGYLESLYRRDYLCHVEDNYPAEHSDFTYFAEQRLSDIASHLTVEELQQARVPIEEKWSALFARAQELFGWPESLATRWIHPPWVEPHASGSPGPMMDSSGLAVCVSGA